MKKEITLQESTQAFLSFLEQSGKSPRTRYTYGKDLEQIQAFFGPEREMN
jgi:hypothetical protein